MKEKNALPETTYSVCFRQGVLIYASNEPKSVLARDLGDCRDNLRNSRSVFLIVELLVIAILTNYLSLYQIFLL